MEVHFVQGLVKYPGRNWEPRSPSLKTMWWVVGGGPWVVGGGWRQNSCFFNFFTEKIFRLPPSKHAVGGGWWVVGGGWWVVLSLLAQFLPGQIFQEADNLSYDFKVKGGDVFSGVKCEYLPNGQISFFFWKKTIFGPLFTVVFFRFFPPKWPKLSNFVRKHAFWGL